MGMTQTKTVAGETYTMDAEGTYRDERGGDYPLFEKGDMLSKLRWCEKELRKISKKDLETYDGAALYTEIKGIEAQTEEDLWLLEQLYG